MEREGKGEALTDLWSAIELGEALAEVLTQSFKAESDVTKGQIVVADTHTADEYASVAAGGAGAVDAVGVALQDIDAGEWGPVLLIGVVKVTASGSITAGNKVRPAATGKVQAMPTTPAAGDEKQIIGKSLQDAADGDMVVILLGVI